MDIGKRVYTNPPSQQVVGTRSRIQDVVEDIQAEKVVPVVMRPNQFRDTFDWTAEKKGIVLNMAKWGIPREDIAAVIGCSLKSLLRHCKDELTNARIHANVSVAEVFFKMATSGKIPMATMHWMKARVPGFKDQVEHSGAVIHAHTDSAIDPTKLSTEQLRALEAAYATGAKETIDIECSTEAEK